MYYVYKQCKTFLNFFNANYATVVIVQYANRSERGMEKDALCFCEKTYLWAQSEILCSAKWASYWLQVSTAQVCSEYSDISSQYRIALKFFM